MFRQDLDNEIDGFLLDPETLEFEINVDGFTSSGGLGGPAILMQSLAKMAQMTTAYPDGAFSGVGGISTWADALSFGPDGWLYLADSAIPDQVMRSKRHIASQAPYYIFRFRPGVEGVPGH